MKKVFIAIIIITCVCFYGCGDLLYTDSNPSNSVKSNTAASENEVAYEVTYQNAKLYKNSIGTMYVQIIFEITNTGTSRLYLKSGSCDLEDGNGKLIASKSYISVYPDVIDPGETAYYYDETTIDNLNDVIDLTIIPRPDVSKAKVDTIRFKISDEQFSPGSYNRGIKMMGRVENTTDKEQSMVYVAAILLDVNRIPIGQIFTIIMEDLKPGEKIGFEKNSLMLPDDVTLESVAYYIFYAYPNQYQF